MAAKKKAAKKTSKKVTKKKAKKPPVTFELEVQFPLSSGFGDTDRVLKDLVGQESDGSGAGLGARDLSWCGLSSVKIKNIFARLIPVIKKMDLTINIRSISV